MKGLSNPAFRADMRPVRRFPATVLGRRGTLLLAAAVSAPFLLTIAACLI